MTALATEPPLAPGAFARLSHFRWTLPVWGEVIARRGARTVELRHALGVAPVPLRRSLDRLTLLDLVVPNPGYGHPMRPEWVLGVLGKELASPAQRLLRCLAEHDLEERGRKKWSLPTLLAVGGAERFNEISEALPEASPRAVTLALRDLVDAGWIVRSVEDTWPPQVRYRLTALGRRVVKPARAIARRLVA